MSRQRDANTDLSDETGNDCARPCCETDNPHPTCDPDESKTWRGGHSPDTLMASQLRDGVPKLELGIWEQLLSTGLREALGRQDLHAEIADLEPADAPTRLAKYLTPLVERAVRSIG